MIPCVLIGWILTCVLLGLNDYKYAYYGREDFRGEKTPLKITILSGRIFGEGVRYSEGPLLPGMGSKKIFLSARLSAPEPKKSRRIPARSARLL